VRKEKGKEEMGRRGKLPEKMEVCDRNWSGRGDVKGSEERGGGRLSCSEEKNMRISKKGGAAGGGGAAKPRKRAEGA